MLCRGMRLGLPEKQSACRATSPSAAPLQLFGQECHLDAQGLYSGTGWGQYRSFHRRSGLLRLHSTPDCLDAWLAATTDQAQEAASSAKMPSHDIGTNTASKFAHAPAQNLPRSARCCKARLRLVCQHQKLFCRGHVRFFLQYILQAVVLQCAGGLLL